jgi:hypothetical protein
MVAAVRRVIVGREVRVLREVIESLDCSANSDRVASGAQIAAVDCVFELRCPRAAAARRDVDDAGERIAAVDHTVGFAQHFDAIDPRGVELREIEAAADIVGRYAVDQHFGEVRVAAAQEQRCRSTALAQLNDLRARHESKRFEHVGLVERVQRAGIDDRDLRAGARLQDLSRFGGDDDILLQRSDLERHFHDFTRSGTNVDRLTCARAEPLRRGPNDVAPGRERCERKRPVATARSVRHLHAISHQGHAGARDAGAQRVDDGAGHCRLPLRHRLLSAQRHGSTDAYHECSNRVMHSRENLSWTCGGCD